MHEVWGNGLGSHIVAWSLRRRTKFGFPASLHEVWGNGLGLQIAAWSLRRRAKFCFLNIAAWSLRRWFGETHLWCGGRELTVFGMLVRVLRLFSQNVAVSKSRHRLLFYPTRKGKKHRKIPFSRCFSVSGGRLYYLILFLPFLFVVIHGLLVTCSLCFQNCFSLCLWVWRSFLFERCKCEKDVVFERSSI